MNQPTYQQLQDDFHRDPAFAAVTAKLYSHLRAIAANLRRSHRYATLQTTELVHEALMKLMRAESLQWESEKHFQRIVTAAMKQIMIDAARRRNAERHGGGLTRVPMDEWLELVSVWDDTVLDLTRALDEFGETNSREAQAVDLRHFGGFTVPEIAAVLQISDSTVREDLRFATSFLTERIKRHCAKRTGDGIGTDQEQLTAGQASR